MGDDEDGDLHRENGHVVHHDSVNIGQHSAEDLRSQLSRYEQQLSRGVDMDSPHVKTEDDEEILVTVSKSGSGATRMDHEDAGLLIAPDDDEDNEDDDDDDIEAEERERQHQHQQQQQREDMEAALVLAHQDHQQQNENFLKENDFVHHTPPPPPLPPPLPHLSRDLDRLSMHSLDLSIPRSTAHLLEHFSRSNPHVLEHLANRASAAGGGGHISPSQDNQSSTTHGNLHLGQLGVQFHGIVDSLPRPLPHRMDHVIGHHHHLQSSLDHLSSRHDDVMMTAQDSHNVMDAMSPPMKSHTTAVNLDGHVGQSSHQYVVEHLTRYATSQHHAAMDHAFQRGGSSSSANSASLIDPTLLRAGMEAAALARPSPRSGRSFTAYGIEHSVGASQGLSSSYLLQNERLSRPSSAYGMEHRATPHSLDLTTSRGGGGGAGGGGAGPGVGVGGGGSGTGASNGSCSLDSPSQSHDGDGRGNGGISPTSSYGQENSPPVLSSSSSSTSSYQDPSKLPASLSASVSSQLPPPPSSPALPASSSVSSIHSTYPTYLEYY